MIYCGYCTVESRGKRLCCKRRGCHAVPIQCLTGIISTGGLGLYTTTGPDFEEIHLILNEDCVRFQMEEASADSA